MMCLGLSQQNLQEVGTKHTPVVPGVQLGREDGSTRSKGAKQALASQDLWLWAHSKMFQLLLYFLKVLFFSSSPEELIKAMTVSFKRLKKLQLVNSVRTATTSSMGGQAEDKGLGC